MPHPRSWPIVDEEHGSAPRRRTRVFPLITRHACLDASQAAPTSGERARAPQPRVLDHRVCSLHGEAREAVGLPRPSRRPRGCGDQDIALRVRALARASASSLGAQTRARAQCRDGTSEQRTRSSTDRRGAVPSPGGRRAFEASRPCGTVTSSSTRTAFCSAAEDMRCPLLGNRNGRTTSCRRSWTRSLRRRRCHWSDRSSGLNERAMIAA